MWRAINGYPSEGDTVGQDRKFIAEKFGEHDFAHGAHTDDHAAGEMCGCGAIDKYPIITANALKFRDKITETLKVLYGEDYEDNRETIEEIFLVYEDMDKKSGSYFSDASGRASMQQILDSGAVVKELSGGHVEDTIVINITEINHMAEHRIYSVAFADIYRLYLQKVERKGHTKSELDKVLIWLTGYSPSELDSLVTTNVTLRGFFEEAPSMNPNAIKIIGVICGVRIEELEDPLMKKIRWMDKLVDEITKNRSMEKILRP